MGTPAGSLAQMRWSQPTLTTMQQHSRSIAQLALCSLSTVAMSSSRQNVAVLASAPGDAVVLQLLSVSTKGSTEELSTHVLQLDSGPDVKLSQSKWCCCCGLRNEVLLWRQGGKLYKWNLQSGML